MIAELCRNKLTSFCQNSATRCYAFQSPSLGYNILSPETHRVCFRRFTRAFYPDFWAMLPQILLNVPLTTTLLTHGAAILFLLWYVRQIEN